MSELGALCQDCALCCDGTLFVRVGVTAAEAAQLATVGVVVAFRAKEKRVLPQPCAGLQGKRCGCYAVRPEPCHQFVCLLGRALEGGEVTLEGARELVAEAMRRRAALAAVTPEGPEPLMRRARERLREDEAVRAAYEALEAHLRHWFLGVAGVLGAGER